MGEFANKRFFVTGGGSGIGRATAAYLIGGGARVALFDASAGNVQSVQAELTGLGGNVRAFSGDVRNRAALAQAVDAVAGEWGGLDGLVCAAGILRSGRLATLSAESWDEVMDINVKGVLFACQEALRVMLAQPWTEGSPRRKIAVISSATAASPKVGLGAYAISKVALINLVKVLANEHAGEGINVNAVAPGTIVTPMVQARLAQADDGTGFKLYGSSPIGRLGEPEDVARTIGFLCSDKADFINGAVVAIDGGTTATFPV